MPMMWKQKRPGGSTAVLAAEIDLESRSHAVDDRHLESSVREAAEARRFHLHYHPFFSVTEDAVVGVEALLRWDADVGRISPGRFVPVLEETGLIRAIGEWVLTEACREVGGWLVTKEPALLAVN